MAGNIAPIFSRAGDIQGGVVLTTAAADYTGQGINNAVAFTADSTNGGFLQRLRFKALGTNVATVCRIFVNNGNSRLAAAVSAPSAAPTGVASTSDGALPTGSYYAKVVAVDAVGGLTAASSESSAVSVTGPTGSITWSWTAVTGATSYQLYVGLVAGGEGMYYTTTTNSYTQVDAGTRDSLNGALLNNWLYGEISLPATTAAAATATIDIDYPMNFALGAGQRIIVGLGTTVAAGWAVTAIAGAY